LSNWNEGKRDLFVCLLLINFDNCGENDDKTPFQKEKKADHLKIQAHS
jgi:hypothetical protein